MYRYYLDLNLDRLIVLYHLSRYKNYKMVSWGRLQRPRFQHLQRSLRKISRHSDFTSKNLHLWLLLLRIAGKAIGAVNNCWCFVYWCTCDLSNFELNNFWLIWKLQGLKSYIVLICPKDNPLYSLIKLEFLVGIYCSQPYRNLRLLSFHVDTSVTSIKG